MHISITNGHRHWGSGGLLRVGMAEGGGLGGWLESTKGIICMHISITNGHRHWGGGGLPGGGMAGSGGSIREKGGICKTLDNNKK